ncbi:exported hypothetical protein [Thiomonas delicata]|uniref:Uncharacterized protein n=1 Tax=Thiomonas delicata TaxID=364030 RepID=A0A238D3P1_THIDL|nr:exported hypothetical protein [Thiomonas delicata]
MPALQASGNGAAALAARPASSLEPSTGHMLVGGPASWLCGPDSVLRPVLNTILRCPSPFPYP